MVTRILIAQVIKKEKGATAFPPRALRVRSLPGLGVFMGASLIVGCVNV
jgi:hypothetical protein